MYKTVIKKIKALAAAKKEKREFANTKELSNLYAVFHSSPEGKWILGKTETLALYKMIKKFQPQNMLELGLGIGASAATMALASGQNAKITSIEQFEKCVKIAKELIPSNLQEKINFVLSDTHAFQNSQISKYQYFSGYKNIPVAAGLFDFVLMDGPGAWVEDGKLVALPNGDIINLLPRLAAECKILVDGRKSAVELYQRYLSNYIRVLEENKNYTIFERTEKHLVNLDMLETVDRKLVKRKSDNYFS